MRDNESSSADPFAKIHTGGGSAAQLCEVASVRVVVRGDVDPGGRGREGGGKGEGEFLLSPVDSTFHKRKHHPIGK